MTWHTLDEVYMGDWKDDLPHGKGEHIWGKFHVFFFFFYTLTYVLIFLFYKIIIFYWHYSLKLFITTEKKIEILYDGKSI